MVNITTEALSPTTTIINQTSSSEEDSAKHSLLIFKIACLCTISIVGMIGNVAIITTLVRHKLKSTEYFILNLAFTDMMVCSIGIPLDIYEQLHADAWQYGAVLCKIIYPSQTLLMLTSIMTLTAMSLERYRAIVTPMKQLFRKTVIMVIIGTIWCLAAAVVLPYATILTYTNDFCVERWPGENDADYYTLALFIIDYCIPLTIIAYCYSRAGFELYRNAKRFNNDAAAHTTSKSQSIALQRRLERNKRVIKLFSFAVLIFVICMLPGDCYWMWISFGEGSSFKYENHLQTFTNILVYANSAINPFIFGAYQQGLLRTLCKRGRRREPFSRYRTSSMRTSARGSSRRTGTVRETTL